MSNKAPDGIRVQARSQMSDPKNFLTHLIAAGFVAGALDIAYACLFWAVKANVPAMRIFQSIAEGLLGRGSFEGGAATAALGLALHFAIATVMAGAYFFAAAKWGLLWRQPVVFGALYGAFLYAFMNYVVVPISAASPGSTDPTWIWMSVLVHMLLVGVPIALFAKRTFLQRF
jgi:hypothetical protein